MKFVVVISLVAAGHFTSAQYNPQQKERHRLDTSLSLTGKKPNAFLDAVKVPIVLVSLGAYSCLSDDVINRYEVREERNEHLPHFQTKVDNYLMHAPVAIMYGLNIAGIKGKHDFRNRTLLLVKSEAIMLALTYSFKSLTNIK